MLRQPLLLVLLLFGLLAPLPLHSQDLPASDAVFAQTIERFPLIIEQSKAGVVYIEVSRKSRERHAGNRAPTGFFNDPDIKRFFGDEPDDNRLPQQPDIPSFGHGSGFIISTDGHILTNHHVVDRADEITVTLADRRRLPAELIGSDSRSDIGLIKIDAGRQALTVLPLGSSEHLKAGQWVLAFGSPFANLQTVTAGIVSATGRNSLGISDYEDFIQTDAAINPGNSGGPLVDIGGRVVGMNTAFITQTGGYMGVGFAIPIDMARDVAGQLLENGRVERGWLGVALKDVRAEDLVRHNLPLDTRAARIEQVQENSPAAAAKLRSDDLIISIDNVAINGPADLRNRVALTAPDTAVSLALYRDGDLRRVTVTLGILK
ncbi:MAG: trypsin-like peptidase domain-containing protein [Desulfobulbaceae bacterium]|nr:trypsin-like peptidase domain-containing protein [Desulfobulbaceae bacterium]